jgi:hypothetical protein
MTTLASIRSRLMAEHNIAEADMKPLLVEGISKDQGYSILKKRVAPIKTSTLFLNLNNTASYVNLSKFIHFMYI